MDITNKEKQIIEALEFSDFANESEAGLYGYIHYDEWNMIVYRGVMSSLSKKGVVVWSEAEYVNDDPNSGMIWGYINPEYTTIKNEFASMNWDAIKEA